MVRQQAHKRAYRFRFYPTPEQEQLLRRTVDGPRDVGLTPDRAAELFFRDIMASIEQGEDR